MFIREQLGKNPNGRSLKPDVRAELRKKCHVLVRERFCDWIWCAT